MYVSTRGTAPILPFQDAMRTGLARDGGLYVPQSIPQMSHADIAALAGLSYEEIAFRVMRPFVGDTFTDAEFGDIIAKAMEHGLMCLVAGPNVLRFAPSLVIPDADIDEGMARLGAALADITSQA